MGRERQEVLRRGLVRVALEVLWPQRMFTFSAEYSKMGRKHSAHRGFCMARRWTEAKERGGRERGGGVDPLGGPMRTS